MKTLLIAAALILTSISVAVASEPVTPSVSGDAAPDSSGTAPAPAAKPAKPPKPPRPKMDCEEVKELGSIFSHQVCTTEAQRDARRRRDLEEINRFRDGQH